MKKSASAALLAWAVLGTNTPASAKPITFRVNDPNSRDLVSFTSVAPLEMVQGNTSRILGQVTIDDSFDLTKEPLKAQFDVDLRALDTGIAMRNDDMKDDFLETAKHPLATFVLKSLHEPGVLVPGVPKHLQAAGEFSLHGFTTSREIPVEVTYFPCSPLTQRKVRDADLLQITAEFIVPFSDYHIKRPEMFFQKLADRVTVKVSATAYSPIAKKPAK